MIREKKDKIRFGAENFIKSNSFDDMSIFLNLAYVFSGYTGNFK